MPATDISRDQLVGVLGAWSHGAGPMYARLASAVAEAIEGGHLPPGSRLPPERALASALALSRSTVVAAYDRLDEQEWVERRQGSGTYVRGVHASSPAASSQLAASLDANTMFRGLITGTGDVIDFSLAADRKSVV